MAHHVRGFVARHADLSGAACGLPGARVVPLRLGFAFLPVTIHLAGDDEPAPFEHLERLTTRLATWAGELSRAFPLAYIETDYFGGDGWQAAVAWADGRMVFGPVRTTDLYEGGQLVSAPLLEGAINRAVRNLGVERGTARDEFDALGLGRHRSNEGWLTEAGPQRPETT